MTDTELKRRKAICEAAHVDEIDDVSDGFHTFRQLYYQRMMLFAAIVKQNKDKAWKSLRHEDGELCFGGGWFIVGIDTPEGSYTYHYEDNYSSLFDCEELEYGKHWDGHTEKDVTRLLSLISAQPKERTEERMETHACDLIDRQAAIDALEAQERQRATQKRRYTFGNDEFSLEAAYHDCKLVFDGITDDDSFQEADTGLILYYANEIIYALHEALEGKDTNVPTNDCISRQAAIDACIRVRELRAYDEIEEIKALPSAQPDTRLEKIADLVDGSIDHFDLEDAMDLLYQIKDVLNG